jgi:hypothetical protein
MGSACCQQVTGVLVRYACSSSLKALCICCQLNVLLQQADVLVA